MTTIQIKKDGQDPQVINVPEGAKIIIEDGVTIVEPKFKDGDVVYWENDREAKGIAIFKKYHSINSFRFDYHFLLRIDFNSCSYKDWADCTLGSSGCMRLATESEKQLLIDALEKDGNQWNPETKQIEELKYITKEGDCVEFDYRRSNSIKKGYFVVKKIDGEAYKCGDWLPINYTGIFEGKSFSCSKEINCFTLRKITPEELQSKFNELGYEYSFETHTAEKLRWKPKIGEEYYYPTLWNEDLYRKCTNTNVELDNICIANKFAFKTPEEAIEVSKKWLQQL